MDGPGPPETVRETGRPTRRCPSIRSASIRKSDSGFSAGRETQRILLALGGGRREQWVAEEDRRDVASATDDVRHARLRVGETRARPFRERATHDLGPARVAPGLGRQRARPQ